MDTSLAQARTFVNPSAVRGARPLAARVAEAVESYAFAFEFTGDDGVDIFGCYYADDLTEPAYALEVRDGQIVRCNCADAQCRKRTCKHQILLCLATGYGIKSPDLPPVVVAAMNTVFHAPRPVAAGPAVTAWGRA